MEKLISNTLDQFMKSLNVIDKYLISNIKDKIQYEKISKKKIKKHKKRKKKEEKHRNKNTVNKTNSIHSFK